MKNVLLAVLCMASLAAFALGSGQSEIAAAPHDGHDMSMMQACPMGISGAEIAVTDSKDGIIIMITTKSGDVADLRRRTESMARMHAEASNKETHGHMIPFSVSYEEVENGARLALVPRDAPRLEEFRAAVQRHANMMSKGECAMMQGMMQGMATEKPIEKPKSDETDHSAHH